MEKFFSESWQGQFGLGILVFLLSFVVAWALRRLLGVLGSASTQNEWLRSLGSSLYVPSLWVVWGLGTIIAAEICFSPAEYATQRELLGRFREVYLVVAMTWLLFRWKDSFEELLLQRVSKRGASRSDQALVAAMSRLMSVAVFSLAAFMVFDILGVPVSGLLAVGGVGALAISWAAKDVVANFFGGLMIFINRPFGTGDWIKSPNKNFEGVVEHIGWYMTQIRTFERRPTYIPNALVTDAIIENPGRMYNRRIKFDLGIRYDDVAVCRQVRDEMEAMLRRHPGIDQNQILMVHFLEYGPYSLDINVYCFTKTTNWAEYREVHQDVLLKIADIVAELGAEIAFPTQTLHMSKS